VKFTFLKPGLLSVTFRQLSASEIIETVAEAGLQGIEWGGDIHVPPGDTANAERIGRQTREAGLQVSAYGSYYDFGDVLPTPNPNTPEITAVIDCAEALGTRTIRIWPGKIGSAEASEDWFAAVVARTQEFADLAHQRGISLGFEYHSNSLTDTAASTQRLLAAIQRDTVSTFWQTNRGGAFIEELDSIRSLKSQITNLHCHHLIANQQPPFGLLEEGHTEWMAFLKELQTANRSHWISIEFVKDGTLDSFRSDASTLLEWCKAFESMLPASEARPS
jgi:sugar phosphate isomerase/epimerase